MSILLNNFYTTDKSTDSAYLYNSLGSFWTQVFQEKEFLKGYTLAMAEELAQQYINLVEVVNNYSCKDIAVFHKEKWFPLYIKKSEFSKSTFLFEPDSAVFGEQPNTDRFYAGNIFKFGNPKDSSSSGAYSYTPTVKLRKVNCVANRIISPSALFVSGVDYIIKGDVLYFNQNIFDNPYIPKTPLLQDDSTPATYVDSSGKTVTDELLILWGYNAEIDNSALYNNFGVIYDFKLNSSEKYKDLLKALINVSVEGATLTALKTLFCSLTDNLIIVETQETVEDIYSDYYWRYVVTDKHVYRFNLNQSPAKEVQLGAVLSAGDLITSDVYLADSVSSPKWWLNALELDKLAFAPYVFAADVKNQLFFENKNTSITYSKGKLNFPVLGRPEDVDKFQNYINNSANKESLLKNLDFQLNDTTQIKPINPLNFLFEYIFKNNTLLLKLSFSSEKKLNYFFDILPIFKDYLPSHVYILVVVSFSLSAEELSYLNSGLKIEGFASSFSFDGSESITGSRPEKEGDDPDYYKDYKNRLFSVSISPSRDVNNEPKPLHYTENLDELFINSTVGIVCGEMRTEIPDFVPSPGEDGVFRRPSTREIQSILLIDF